jgi:hypothetical protein
MHVTWWHQIEFAANWKIAQEAFFEAYHVMQTHPEMALFERDDDYPVNASYLSVPEQGHTWMDTAMNGDPADIARHARPKHSAAEQYMASLTTMWQGAQSMTNERQAEIAEETFQSVPEASFFEEFYKRVYADAAERGVPLPPVTEKMTNHWTAFPNYTGVIALGCSLTYRSRPHPTDPNKCIYDFWGLEIPPDGTPVTRPQIAAEDAPTWDDLWFVQQDASNIERMQTGVRTNGHKVQRLAPELEKMIVNWHQVLDQHIAKYTAS